MARHERQHPDARNFGLRSRDMYRAGQEALREGMASHASRATMADRWRPFCAFARNELGISDMRRIETAHLERYAGHLHERLDQGEIGASTAQNYLSAVNRVMEIARGDRQVRLDPVRGAGLPNRTGIATGQHAMSQVEHDRLRELVPERLAVQLELQRVFGLRFEESAKADARTLLAQARARGVIRIEDGTKGGRPRAVPITSEQQITALAMAAELQGQHRSLIPADQTYAAYRESCYRHGIRFHSERHAYAQVRYATIARAPCPVAAGIPHSQRHAYLAAERGISVAAARELDQMARRLVAAELGHGRIDVTNNYLG